MIIILTVQDLLPFRPDIDQTRARELIADVHAIALAAAPCLAEPMFPLDSLAAVKAILRQAVLRRDAAGPGGGAVTTWQETAGPLNMSQTLDTSRAGSILWPSEIAKLRDICREWKGEARPRRAFSVVPR